MVDFNAKGSTGAPFRFDVEYGKLQEFARAIATDDPSTDLDNGHALAVCVAGACDCVRAMRAPSKRGVP